MAEDAELPVLSNIIFLNNGHLICTGTALLFGETFESTDIVIYSRTHITIMYMFYLPNCIFPQARFLLADL